MKEKRSLFWLLGFIFFCGYLSAQPPKRVYITLDVSSSMSGNKYVMANYTAQLLSVFCDPQDYVSIYYLGTKHDLTGKEDYKKLHKSFDQLPAQKASYHEVSDLLQFMRDYRPNTASQDWLFIIGDGDWNWNNARQDYDRLVKSFGQFVKDNHIQVCYLQTGDDIDKTYDFTSYLQKLVLPGVEIKKSDTSAASVQGNAVYFANKILGFSSTGIKMKKTGKNSVEFSSEFPLKGFRLLYQDYQGNQSEIKVASAKCDNKTVTLHPTGNPTTKPLVEAGKSVLNGMIWDCKQRIPANKTVTITFNQEVDVANLRLYPSVDVTPIARPMNVKGLSLTESEKNTFAICEKENKLKVTVDVVNSKGKKFPPPLMQKMIVQVDYGSGGQTASYQASDTTFVILVPITNDTLSYHVTVQSPGYFNRLSEMQTVIKTEKCPPDPIPLVTLPTQHFAAVKFKDLFEGKPFGGTINDTLFQQLYAYGFDSQQIDNNQYKDSVSFNLLGDSISFIHLPKNNWCECAFPDTLHYTLVLKSTSGIVVGGKTYEGFVIPVSVPVDKRSWLKRCQRYLLALCCLLFVFIYLLALRRKKRFGKSARIIPSYFNSHGILVALGCIMLRKKGFGPWFSRWFLPGDERRVFHFTSPSANFTFIATESPSKVLFPISNYNPQTMNVTGIVINPKNKFVTLHNGSVIDIQKQNGVPDGNIEFHADTKNDSSGYKIFLGILILATFAALVYVIYMLIRGI